MLSIHSLSVLPIKTVHSVMTTRNINAILRNRREMCQEYEPELGRFGDMAADVRI